MILDIMGGGGLGSKEQDTDYITSKKGADNALLLALDLPNADEEQIRIVGNAVTSEYESNPKLDLAQLQKYVDMVQNEVKEASVTVAIVGEQEVGIANCGNNTMYCVKDGKISCISIRQEEGMAQVNVFPNQLSQGDAFLLVTDGFASKLREQEILLDYLKSETAEQWLAYLMTRIGLRLDEESDCYSAIAVINI